MTATYLDYSFPVLAAADPGAIVDIETLLGEAFGPDYGGYAEYWLAYNGPVQLQQWNFSYWDPSTPSVGRWFVNGSDIGGTFRNETDVLPGQLGTADLHAGNDIGPFAYITVPIAGSPGNWTEWIQYAVTTVAPALISPTAGEGEPTVADLLASAQRFAATYIDVANDNDCHHIAEAVAGAAGATLPYLSYLADPAQNEEGGFWRIVYRGSDPNPVADWQTLVQPGDIVRMSWKTGGQHTTTVLSINSDGTLQVYDNVAYDGNTEIIGIHNADYDQDTKPDSITIYRLTTDGLYLINGTSQSETLHGTLYNDLIADNGGTDTMAGWIGDDVYVVNNGSDAITENAGQGNDIVRASVDYTLPANIESIVLQGTGNINATGNSDGNALAGNAGNNMLDGMG